MTDHDIYVNAMQFKFVKIRDSLVKQYPELRSKVICLTVVDTLTAQKLHFQMRSVEEEEKEMIALEIRITKEIIDEAERGSLCEN